MTTTAPALPLATFAYEAQTEFGQPLSGTLEAYSPDDARLRLMALRLRVIEIHAAETPRRGKRSLGRDDFVAFNTQLAHLAAAGLPLESGLRLIAQDLSSGRLRTVATEIANDLDAGVPLAQAFQRHRGRFPDLYARLIESGVRTGNLPGVLLNLGQHIDLVARLRQAVWRVMSYPIAVLIGLALIVIFLSTYVLPQLTAVFRDFRTTLPVITTVVMTIGEYMPAILIATGITVAVLIAAWQAARLAGKRPMLIDRLILPLPIIGPVLKRNMLARWCDALKLAVNAGLDLPAGFTMAGQVVGSPKLIADSNKLAGLLEAGRSLREYSGGRIIPPAVAASIELSPRGDALATSLATLATMYQHQAEQRLRTVPTMLTPFMLMIIAGTLGVCITAIFLPLVKLIQSISGGDF